MLSYLVRRNAFSKEEEWLVSDTALIKVLEGVQVLNISFADIKSLRLYYNPLRYRTYNYECEVIISNTYKIKIQSTSYDSFATFTNQANSYHPFIKGLVALLTSKNKTAKVFTGFSKKKFIFTYAISLAIVILVVYILSHFPGAKLIGLLMFAYFAFYIIVGFKKNWPKNIVDNNIPENVLPSLTKIK